MKTSPQSIKKKTTLFLAAILASNAWGKPPKGKQGNWLQTVPGKSWWLALRMYGPEQAWIDQSWRPGELELVE